MDAEKNAPYVVDQTATVETALALIEQNRHRSLVVIDAEDVVVGTLSDGDVRKAILDHRLLSTIPVQHIMNTNFIALTPEQRDGAHEIFEREHIFLIPVIDDAGRLLDVIPAYP
jgi:CBS domain-containing protein